MAIVTEPLPPSFPYALDARGVPDKFSAQYDFLPLLPFYAKA